MHIILGLLGTLVTVLYLVNRIADLGIDFGALNPFYWRRRRAWRKRYEGDPIHAVEDTRDIAALFVVGVAKMDGDISAEQKQAATAAFESAFSMSSQEAAQLLGSSAHLLGQPQLIRTQLDAVLERNSERFNAEQAASLIGMVREVAAADGETNAEQRELIATLEERLPKPAADQGTWSERG